MDDGWERNNLLALVKADKPDWMKIVQRLVTTSEEAWLTDPLTKMNMVHLVVQKRRTCPDFEVVLATVKGVMAQNADAAVGCDNKYGFTPLAFLCDTAPDNYRIAKTNEELEQFMSEDASLITALHDMNDIAMDMTSKRGLSPLAVHVEGLSRLMRQRKFDPSANKGDIAVDVSTSPVLEVLLEKSSLEDCSQALNTLYICNTAAVMEHYALEEERALVSKEPSEGLENGWWLLDLMVQVLFAAHNQLYRGQTITNFSPLHTLSAMPDVPICFLLLAIRADVTEVRKTEKTTGNLPIHNVANWNLPDGDPITRKSICLTTLLNLYPEADTVRNDDGETPTDIFYRKTNTTDEEEE